MSFRARLLLGAEWLVGWGLQCASVPALCWFLPPYLVCGLGRQGVFCLQSSEGSTDMATNSTSSPPHLPSRRHWTEGRESKLKSKLIFQVHKKDQMQGERRRARCGPDICAWERLRRKNRIKPLNVYGVLGIIEYFLVCCVEIL